MTDSEPVTGECNFVSTACKSLKFYKTHFLKKKKQKKRGGGGLGINPKKTGNHP